MPGGPIKSTPFWFYISSKVIEILHLQEDPPYSVMSNLNCDLQHVHLNAVLAVITAFKFGLRFLKMSKISKKWRIKLIWMTSTMRKRGDQSWPPRSPDQTVCDFLLWAYLKHQIWNAPHYQQPSNLRELRETIVTSCRNLDPQMIQSSFDCMLSRARNCILVRGNAFPNE